MNLIKLLVDDVHTLCGDAYYLINDNASLEAQLQGLLDT
jgi:hypothetical protein